MTLGSRKRAWEVGRRGHDTYEWCACKDCGRERWVIVIKGRPNSGRCVRCAQIIFSKQQDRRTHQAWKGGRFPDSMGYVRVYITDDHPLAAMRMGKGKYVLEHRLVMATALGRCLSRWEIVHHKDGVRHHNDLDNLELTSLGHHIRQHSQGYQHGFLRGYQDGLAAAGRKIA